MRIAIVLLAACGTESIEEDNADTAAMTIASTLQREVDAMRDAEQIVRGEMPAGFEADDGGVRGVRGGYDFRYTPACRDDMNRARTCDPSTDNASMDVMWSGWTATDIGVSVTSRDGAWDFVDFTDAKLRIDGASHLEYASELDDVRHDVSYDASYRRSVWFRGERWPRGGEIRYALGVERVRDGERRAFETRAIARFAASGIATISIGEREYTLSVTGELTGPGFADRK